jgi:hypothetical protein
MDQGGRQNPSQNPLDVDAVSLLPIKTRNSKCRCWHGDVLRTKNSV